MRFALPIILLSVLTPSLPAAPVVIYLSRSPFCLISENVKVNVAPDMSMIDGTFDYKYVPRYDLGPRSDNVDFKFPVFVPSEVDEVKTLSDITQFKLMVDNVTYEPVDLAPLDTKLGPPPTLVPDGTKVVLAVFSIPRTLLQERCTLHVSYFQPHYRLGGETEAAYFPLLPDFDRMKNELLFSRDDFSVTFEALGDVRLHRLSANRVVIHESPTEIQVRPVDRENIVVTVGRRAPAKASPPKP